MAAKWIALNIQIDSQNKTWKIQSLPMDDLRFQKVNYDDIAAIFKSHPETFKTQEERTLEGKFRSFTVTT